MVHILEASQVTGRPSRGIARLIFRVFAVLALLSACASAQQYLGTISGMITDPTGAVITGAQVAAQNTSTHFVSSATTNQDGIFAIPFLTPGTYSLTVTAQGFRPETRTGVELTAGTTQRTDVSLKVGNQNEQVVVTAETAQVDTSTANLGTTLQSKQVTDLPNVGRNPFVLSTLAAGVTTQAYMQQKSSGFTNPFSGTAVQIVANGSSGHNRLTLDGSPDDPAERLSGASYTGFVPSPEAVEEVKTQTALYDAQYGHGNGAVLNTVLKSGSDQFHGSAYYVFRNTYMDANTAERRATENAATNPTLRANDQWSQPGFVIDGPVIIPHLYDGRGKTYFMAAYERLQLQQPLPFSGLVPTAAERGGDFSALCSNFVARVCAPGAGVQIYDPTTADGSGNRTPFLGNIIPSGRINAAGAALLSRYPAPNSNLSQTVNYLSSDSNEPNKYFSFVTRVDHSFSDKNKLNAKFYKAILNQLEPNEGFPTPIGPTGIGYTVFRNNVGGGVDDVIVLSPTLEVDARVGVIYHPFGLVYPGNTFNLSTININGTGLPYQSFPGTSFSDSYSGLAAGNTGQISENTLGSTSVLISKIFQRHSLRVGFEGNLVRYNVQNPQSGLGVFNFDRQFTQKNSVSTAVGSDPNSGNPIASLLLGYPSSGSYGNQIAYALQQIYYAPFVQDDWRVSHRLTLNLGLRWDYESPFTERLNRQNTGFCTTCTNPLQALVTGLTLNGGLQFASSSNRYPYKQDWNNLQPRLGVEYQVTNNMVVRGGFGVIYFNTLESPLGQGFSSTTGYVASLDATHPANSLSNPFPAGANLPTGSSLGLATQLGQGLTFGDPDHTQPKITQYSVSIQTQLPFSTVLQVAYVGNKASQLEINKSIDAVPAQYYNQGAAGVTFLQTQVPNPMAGLLPGSSLNSATVQQQFLLTPFPEFTNVTENYIPAGNVVYNALQVSATKLLSHGFSAFGNFTWSHITDQNVYLNAQDSSPSRYQDPNPNLVANVGANYELPRLSGRPGYERHVLGGWQLNGILRAQNGPLIPSPGSSNGGAGTVTLLSNPRLSSPTYGEAFNTCYENAAGALVMSTPKAPACASASSVPAFQQHLAFTLNNIGPYLDVRERVHPLVDVSLFKQFQLRESTNFEIRGEFFNVLNTTTFGAPGTSPGSANFGVVSLTQVNDPRLIQLTVRLNF
jgi:hypothetical protein